MSILDIDPADIPLPDVIPPNRNNGDSLCYLTWILFIITTVVLTARLVSKISILKRFAIDDALMILSWAMIVVYSATIQRSYHFGLGRHYMYQKMIDSYYVIKWAYAAQSLCIFSAMLSRTAFALYLLALIGNAKPSLRYTLWVTLALHVIFNMALNITLWSVCGFDILIIMDPYQTCFKRSPWSAYAHFTGAFNAFTDLILTVVPAMLVLRLRTTAKAKWAAMALLCLSTLAMSGAIWRTLEIDDIFTSSWDFTHHIVPYFRASSLEINVIIITASIPTLGPLFNHLRRNYDRRTLNKSTLNSSSGRHSGESYQFQQNLAHALGIHMPGLGNHVVITGGPSRSRRGTASEAKMPDEDELPLTDMPVIKTTVRTDVKVDTVDLRDGADNDNHLYSTSQRMY